ncbi:tetratricopeptide repeat protein [Frankia sp. B2]|uniref:tetratricopeptide repeat protein n=1 Tax=Frankia sp. B2 TaxID=2541730 RepID=UPI00106AB549|nr:tetratricopeptide repeat protein [Frankia sp. B2]TFE25669.1 tetratricopeptide repeat protein [Frankia sp. B2]
MTGGGDGHGAPDCFVSYADDGRAWAEWIAGTLEDAGYQVLLESWAPAGTHRVGWLDRAVSQARHTIAVVSDGYLRSSPAVAEWAAAWSADPTGGERRLLVTRVADRPLPGLLGQLVPVDLFDRSEIAVRASLLAALRGDRPQPEQPPGFPGRRGIFPPELPAVWNVPDQPARFVGRTAALARLDEALSRSPLVTVTGIAGIGKTSLVTEYVRQHRADLDAVWWVPAERPELIGERVRELAPAVGLPGHAEPAAVIANLGRADGRWLIVLDDAADADTLPDWLRPTEPGRLLLTSRNPGWDHLGPVVPVGPMDRAESVTLLAGRLPAVERTVADRIAERLGDHPLALDQAAHRISTGRTPAETYLQVLIDRPEVLLAQGEVSGRPGATAATLWDEPIRRLDAEAPAAGHLLRIVAHGDNEPIPIRLFTAEPDVIPDSGLRAAAGDPLALADTVGVLERYGLAHRDADTVTMHRLVRTAVHTHTGPDQADEIVATMARMLRASLPDAVTANPEAWPAWRELLPHTLAVLDATATDSTDADSTDADGPEADGPEADGPEAAWLAERSAAYLLGQGRADQALPLAARALAARERLDGPVHVDTLACRETLARVALGAGRIDAAGRLAEHTVADRERILGPEHPDTLVSRDTLAQLFQKVGQTDRAVEMFQRTLATRERILGPEHPDTLEGRHSLGRAYDAAGRGDEAARLLRDTLADQRRILGPEHPATLDTRHSLAVAYRRIGAVGDAVPLFEQTLAARERVLGPEHPAALGTRHQLAVTHHQAGRLDDATREFGRALTGRERTLGPDHPDTLETVDGLARAHLYAGRLDDAAREFGRALTGRERALGPDHPETTETRENLATAHLRLGRPGEAVPHLEGALDRHEHVLGRAHPHTVDTRDTLATTYRRTGQLEAAVPLLERLLADRSRAHGVGDARTLRTADELAEVYRTTGRLPQAVGLNERVLAVRERLLGPGHPDTRATRGALADTYRQAGRPADAVPLYRAALTDALREHGPFHPDSTRARRTLADTVGEVRHDQPPPLERPIPVEPRFRHRDP